VYVTLAGKQVLDDIGHVQLINHMGDDLTPVNAARVSYAKNSLTFTAKDEKLIRYLLREGHGSPFEHCVFQFRITAPLFVVRQWERHRIASYNEQSGRYVEMEPQFYAPNRTVKIASAISYWFYKKLLVKNKKELARIVLPLNLYTTFWWTVNARSLMNFISLRNSEHAQPEIRQYAEAVEVIFAIIMPATYNAFLEYGRKVP
jgi:thymidylate synthase (FAD)